MSSAVLVLVDPEGAETSGRGTGPAYLTVAALNPKKVGSLEDMFLTLASHFSAHGVRSDFLFYRMPIAPIQTALHLRGAGVGRLDMLKPVAAAMALYRLVRQRRYDVVHFHFVRAHSPLMHAAKAAGAKVIVSDHMVLSPKTIRPGTSVIRSGLQRVVDLRLPVSEAVEQSIRLVDRVPADRVAVVRNGVDLARFRVSPELGRETRASLLGGFEGPVVLCPARFAPAKGVEVLVRAVALAGADSFLSRAMLLLAGDGPDQQAVEGLATQLGVRDRLRFLGLRSDLERIYPAADIVCVPSTGPEACSLVVLESQACGVPVVASSIGGIPEMLVDRGTGWLVPPNDPPALAGAIELLLADGALRQRLGQAGRQHAELRLGLQLWKQSLFSTIEARFGDMIELAGTYARLPQQIEGGATPAPAAQATPEAQRSVA